jgi:hypothetical protein
MDGEEKLKIGIATPHNVSTGGLSQPVGLVGA